MQSSPSKRKQLSPLHKVQFAYNVTDDGEDKDEFSGNNQSCKEVNEDEDDDDEDDDITLQDLVAMETMDDADELDMTSENSLRDEDEIYEPATERSLSQTEDSPIMSSKLLKGKDELNDKRLAGSNVLHHINTSLESYRKAMLNLSGK